MRRAPYNIRAGAPNRPSQELCWHRAPNKVKPIQFEIWKLHFCCTCLLQKLFFCTYSSSSEGSSSRSLSLIIVLSYSTWLPWRDDLWPTVQWEDSLLIGIRYKVFALVSSTVWNQIITDLFHLHLHITIWSQDLYRAKAHGNTYTTVRPCGWLYYNLRFKSSYLLECIFMPKMEGNPFNFQPSRARGTCNHLHPTYEKKKKTPSVGL